jgi:hypothetical protein
MNTKKGQFEPAEVGKLIEKHFSICIALNNYARFTKNRQELFHDSKIWVFGGQVL